MSERVIWCPGEQEIDATEGVCTVVPEEVESVKALMEAAGLPTLVEKGINLE